MVNFNKKFYLTSCCLVGIVSPFDCCSQNIDNTLDFVHLTYEIGWRAWASCYRNQTGSILDKRLQDAKFDDSIFNVIAGIIADCKLEKGEFSNENIGMIGNLRLVKLYASPKTFKQEEWNTALLCNVIYFAMKSDIFNVFNDANDPKIKQNWNSYLSQIANNLYKVYQNEVNHNQLKKYLETALYEVGVYSQSLGLYYYMNEYRKANQNNPFSPNVVNFTGYNPNSKNGQFRIGKAYVDLEGTQTPIALDVIVEDGKVAQYKLWDANGKIYDKDVNYIGKFKTFKENFKLDKEFIERQFKNKLLKREQIHNLCNYHNDTSAYQQARDKCYLNSVLQALHASETVRESVKKLNKKHGMPRIPNFGANNGLNMLDVSPVLTKIFNAIENGGMERYINKKDTKQNLQSYSDAVTNLANCLEHSEAWRCAKTSLSTNGRPSNNDILQRYRDLYTNPDFNLDMEVNNTDFHRYGHKIRQAGTQQSIVMAKEITHALAIEALDKQEEPIAPVNLTVLMGNNQPNPKIASIDKFLLLEYNDMIGAVTIKRDYQEVLPKEQTIDPILPSEINQNPGTIVPTVAPVIIKPITYDTNSGQLQIRPQKAYKEITQIVNGKKHKYRLIATVQFPGYGGHFRATILTQDCGWVRIDDIDKTDTAVQLTSDYDENCGQAWGDNRSVVIYEPVY